MFLAVGPAIFVLIVLISTHAPAAPVISYQVRETHSFFDDAATNLLLSRVPLHFGLPRSLAWLVISQKFNNLRRRRNED